MTKRHSHRSGFTLVELSIVLVVIGLIIGGVLSGRQIMTNAQITNAVNAIQAYEAQFQTYIQNYGVMPGDDANAATRFSNAGIPSVTETANGTLEGTFDSETASDESRLLWADLRAAGLVKGSGSDASQPSNPFGGIYGFQHGAFTGETTFTTNVLCLSGVPGDAAMAIDSRLDDGTSNTGSVMVSEDALSAVTGAYDSANTYVLCTKL
ncbi:MAG: type II secretion system protein [Alphaproteobacteria bacterium]|nr:type II secretion system protein [Alphaproteobacteria bacterium]